MANKFIANELDVTILARRLPHMRAHYMVSKAGLFLVDPHLHSFHSDSVGVVALRETCKQYLCCCCLFFHGALSVLFSLLLF